MSFSGTAPDMVALSCFIKVAAGVGLGLQIDAFVFVWR